MKKIVLILIFVTVAANAQWLQVSNGMGNLFIYSLASGSNKMYAGSGDNYGLFVSTNNGINWSQTSLNNREVDAIAVNGNNVYAGTFFYGVYLSTNNGISWSQTSLNNQMINSLIVNGNNVFAGTQISRAYQSTDNGLTWAQTNLNYIVYSLALSSNNIYAGTSTNGVFLSTNNGISWIQTPLNNRSVYVLAVNGNNIYAGTNDSGLYRSTNNGTSWIHISLNNLYVNSLATSGNNIFAGTSNTSPQGVFVSNDNGTSWIQRNEGLINLWVNSLCVFNNYIFAGTVGSSVYRRPLNELIGIQPISTEIPNQFSLSQNYPNPFNPNSKIKMQIAKLSAVKLVVFDVLGREVATLVNEELKPGTYEVDFDGSNFASGVYLYQLKITNYELGINYLETKKMVLMK